ncbi:MAG: nucleoside deaminase [Desulfobacterales bacterium]|nr:nucleoside deaminase [Desulfobacterales bacterium]
MDHDYFMQQALCEAEDALNNGEFPVGCVLVYHNRIIVKSKRSGSTGLNPNEIDHAEMLAIKQLYSLNHSTMLHHDITLYSTLEPCLMCFGAIILSGIRKIVYAYEDVMGGGTRCNLKEMPQLYHDHPLEIIPTILRKQSIDLFKQFFLNPNHMYWPKSLLSDYTLTQS